MDSNIKGKLGLMAMFFAAMSQNTLSQSRNMKSVSLMQEEGKPIGKDERIKIKQKKNRAKTVARRKTRGY